MDEEKKILQRIAILKEVWSKIEDVIQFANKNRIFIFNESNEVHDKIDEEIKELRLQLCKVRGE